MTQYQYTCAFCGKWLQQYEAIKAEFNTTFESDEMIDGVTQRAPTRIVGCTFPIYACHDCIISRSHKD